MDASFAQLVSQTGCFSVHSGLGYVQSSAQSFLADRVKVFDTARSSVIRAIITSPRVTRVLRAKVECFLYRALTIPQWSRLQRSGLDKAVDVYIASVKNEAKSRMDVIQAHLARLEKEF